MLKRNLCFIEPILYTLFPYWNSNTIELPIIKCGTQSVRNLADLSSYSEPGGGSERRGLMFFYKTSGLSIIVYNAIGNSL